MKRILFFTALFFYLSNHCYSQNAVSTAQTFIAQLNSTQQNETLFPFDDDERYNFHFVPIARKGITFNAMNEAQKTAAFNLLKTCLSEETYQKTRAIMQLETVLKALENRKSEDHYRDTGNYHISIFGIPSAKTIWGWRFEGHHLSFNFSFNKKTLVAGTPGFMGSNPAIVLSGPAKGTQVLKEETDKGFALLHALSGTQLQKTMIDSIAYKDILTFDKRNALLANPVGILYSELSTEQQALLLQLISVYVHRYTKLFADDMLKDLQKSGLHQIRFAWAGNTQPELGKGTYYRIQSPTLVIEYDNTQNNANHIHSVLRDLKHDFGGDELLAHYKNAHPN